MINRPGSVITDVMPLIESFEMQTTNCLEIEDGTNSFALEFSQRDFSLLGGPPEFMPLGGDWINTLGVFENTSVARDMKIPPNSTVTRKTGALLVSAQNILNYLSRDADLLSFDYSFRLTKGEDKHKLKGNLSGFKIRDLIANISAQPNGFCTLTLTEVSPTGIGRIVEIIDVRSRDDIQTDDKGVLKIYRSPTEFGWLESLRNLIEFLEKSREDTVKIHHS